MALIVALGVVYLRESMRSVISQLSCMSCPGGRFSTAHQSHYLHAALLPVAPCTGWVPMAEAGRTHMALVMATPGAYKSTQRP